MLVIDYPGKELELARFELFCILSQTEMNRKIILVSTLIVGFWITSCKKSENGSPSPSNFGEDSSLAFSSYVVAGIPNQISINFPNIVVQFPDSVIAPGNLMASFTLSASGDQATILGTRQVSGVNTINFDYAA